MKFHIRHINLFALVATPFLIFAQTPKHNEGDKTVEVVEDDFISSLKNHLVVIPDEATDIDIPIPSFVKKASNHIIFNGADWSELRKAFQNSKKKPVSIVHIGDSHIQADYSSGTTRELLQYDFGNAGRGLITPLKICGTNQPSDYSFSSPNTWKSQLLINRSWTQTVGFTGASIRPVSSTGEITISTSDSEDYNPFSSLTIFHNGKFDIREITGENGLPLKYRAIPSKDYTQIILTGLTSKATIAFNSSGDLTIYGASLSGDRPGVFYHAIGNNGATYNSYNRIGTVGAGINPLNPDLVIISLGTNEAFGSNVNTSAFTTAMDNLIRNIRTANPNALILLTTPQECHRGSTTSTKTRVKVKGKKGRKPTYKTVVKTSRTYAINSNIAPLRQAILDYGKQKGIAVYDWYEVAGGKGSSDTWINANLFAKDRVHHSRKGYNIEGRLLYEAIMDAIRK